MLLTQAAWEQNQLDRFQHLAGAAAAPQAGEEDFRGFEWFYWKRQSERERATLKGHAGGVNSVCVSPDGKRIVSGGSDKTVRVWDVSGPDGISPGKELLTLKGHPEGHLQSLLQPGRNAHRLGDWKGTVKVWDAGDGTGSQHPQGTREQDRQRRLQPRRQTHRFGRRRHPQCYRSIESVGRQDRPGDPDAQGHSGGVHCACISPDGKRIVSGGGDSTVRLWDAETGKEVLSIEGRMSDVVGVFISPDGKRIFFGMLLGSVINVGRSDGKGNSHAAEKSRRNHEPGRQS